jgi:DNA topoisomerase-3
LTLTARHVDDTKVTDHHAIIPTEQRVDPAALSPDEKRLYDLIARRFLAAFYPDAVIERTTIITEVEGERFTTRGAVVLTAGWREVDPPGRERQGGRRRRRGGRGTASGPGARCGRDTPGGDPTQAHEGPAALF